MYACIHVCIKYVCYKFNSFLYVYVLQRYQHYYYWFDICTHKIQEIENRTVGERVLGSAEDVALLLVTTLDDDANGTTSRNITRDNISKL